VEVVLSGNALASLSNARDEPVQGPKAYADTDILAELFAESADAEGANLAALLFVIPGFFVGLVLIGFVRRLRRHSLWTRPSCVGMGGMHSLLLSDPPPPEDEKPADALETTPETTPAYRESVATRALRRLQPRDSTPSTLYHKPTARRLDLDWDVDEQLGD